MRLSSPPCDAPACGCPRRVRLAVRPGTDEFQTRILRDLSRNLAGCGPFRGPDPLPGTSRLAGHRGRISGRNLQHLLHQTPNLEHAGSSVLRDLRSCRGRCRVNLSGWAEFLASVTTVARQGRKETPWENLSQECRAVPPVTFVVSTRDRGKRYPHDAPGLRVSLLQW